jgi:inosose dehydratase
MTYPVGNAPTSWGIEQDVEPVHGASLFLDQVAEAGYQGTELGPYGYLPTEPAVLRAELDRRGLRLTAGYVMDAFHDPGKTEPLVRQAERVCRLLSEVGASRLVLIGGLAPERVATAGRSGAAARLTGSQFETSLRTIAAVGEIAAAHDIVPGIHHHAGTHVEFRDEVDRLLEALASTRVGLVVDTGHCAYAGMDPAELIRAYAHRVTCVHLKDLDSHIRERALGQGLSFWEAYSAGVFCVLGRGAVDFAAVRESLASTGYAGWLTVEQDADPRGRSDPLTDARRSLAYLRTIGLAS